MNKSQKATPIETDGGRSIERSIEIEATPEVVWKALTDAEALARWFPTKANVKPGVGGYIRLHWDEHYDAESPIDIWEPQEHLRIGFPNESKFPLATDYYLEGKGGKTILRVVTSGFGTGEDWDGYFDGVRCGWNFELDGLKHYLENHHGTERIVAQASLKFSDGRASAWKRLTGPGGWVSKSGIADLEEGSSYEITTATGDKFSGTVKLNEPERQFVATVIEWNNALFRFELFAESAVVWLSTYGVSEKDVRDLEARWKESLANTPPA
ncbi:MAG: SRPBCC domain-containing protein [Gemmatimonadota bacterium]|nr:SRPBCC domain-containing protein [Gemmatimonadota bacterium]